MLNIYYINFIVYMCNMCIFYRFFRFQQDFNRILTKLYTGFSTSVPLFYNFVNLMIFTTAEFGVKSSFFSFFEDFSTA